MSSKDEKLHALLAVDEPEPGAGFDAGFRSRLAALKAEEAAEAAEPTVEPDPRLEALLERDAPEPGPGFDAAFHRQLRGARAEVEAEVLPFRDPRLEPRLPRHTEGPSAPPRRSWRWGVGGLLLAAAASVALWITRPTQPTETEPQPEELEMLAHLDLLEVYDEVQALDALEDPETFDVVADLDSLEKLQ